MNYERNKRDEKMEQAKRKRAVKAAGKSQQVPTTTQYFKSLQDFSPAWESKVTAIFTPNQYETYTLRTDECRLIIGHRDDRFYEMSDLIGDLITNSYSLWLVYDPQCWGKADMVIDPIELADWRSNNIGYFCD
jgi:hypothetical protein